MERIPFDITLFCTGRYNVETEEGFPVSILSIRARTGYPIVGLIHLPCMDFIQSWDYACTVNNPENDVNKEVHQLYLITNQ